MLTTKNLLAGLGAFAGLGVAIMPLSSVSAAEPNTTTTVADGVQSDSHEVKARIGELLSIQVTDAYDNTTDNMMTLGAGSVTDNFLTHTIEVKGNTRHDYTLTIAAGEGGNAMKHQTSGISATIPAGTTLNETTSAWGYKYGGSVSTASAGSFTPTYGDSWSAVLATGTANLHTAGDDRSTSYDETHYVRYGVSAAADQVAGIYAANVVYKASAVSGL